MTTTIRFTIRPGDILLASIASVDPLIREAITRRAEGGSFEDVTFDLSGINAAIRIGRQQVGVVVSLSREPQSGSEPQGRSGPDVIDVFDEVDPS